MQQTLNKFKVGFMVLGALLVVLVGYFLIQSLGVRNDNLLQKKATKVAEKINDYVLLNQTIPDSLSDVGAKDVPNAVTYKKLSDAKYEFCVTYKATYDLPDTVQGLALIASYYSDSPLGYRGYAGYTSTETLYIPSEHKKGENCQTIEPYINNSSDYTTDYDYDYQDY